MKYQILTRDEIESNWCLDDKLPEGEEFILYEDGDVYVCGPESDGHIVFTDCIFPDPESKIQTNRIPPLERSRKMVSAMSNPTIFPRLAKE